MLVGPRVRVRPRRRVMCDEECPPCESPWQHPLVVGVVVGIVTTAAQAIGEVWVRRQLGEHDDEPPKPKRGAAK